jgi:hypothetical protein
MNDKMIEQLKNWVTKNYDPHSAGYTYERSEGNYYDCFEDGCECGTSWAAYEVGLILGMELEEPDESDEYE